MRQVIVGLVGVPGDAAADLAASLRVGPSEPECLLADGARAWLHPPEPDGPWQTALLVGGRAVDLVLVALDAAVPDGDAALAQVVEFVGGRGIGGCVAAVLGPRTGRRPILDPQTAGPRVRRVFCDLATGGGLASLRRALLADASRVAPQGEGSPFRAQVSSVGVSPFGGSLLRCWITGGAAHNGDPARLMPEGRDVRIGLPAHRRGAWPASVAAGQLEVALTGVEPADVAPGCILTSDSSVVASRRLRLEPFVAASLIGDVSRADLLMGGCTVPVALGPASDAGVDAASDALVAFAPGDLCLVRLPGGVVATCRVSSIAGPAAAPAQPEPPEALLRDRALRTLRAYHERFPVRTGMPAAELAAAVADPDAPDRLGAWAAGMVEREGDLVRLCGFQPTLPDRQQALYERVVACLAASPLQALRAESVAAEVGARPDAARAMLTRALRRGDAAELPSGLYVHGRVLADARVALEACAAEQGTVGIAEFRDRIGSGRKLALLLLERFDEDGVTVRSGDLRRLRPSDGSPNGRA
ncbi:MAG: SelB C-terminal domain-containing protein [Armatimonadetes bacterium]|nr:SelB C-terminal domain-containing protein [Armatimonadota bacterium]